MELGGQPLFVNNALPSLSIVQAKRGAAPVLQGECPSLTILYLDLQWPFLAGLVFADGQREFVPHVEHPQEAAEVAETLQDNPASFRFRVRLNVWGTSEDVYGVGEEIQELVWHRCWSLLLQEGNNLLFIYLLFYRVFYFLFIYLLNLYIDKKER